MLQVEDSHCLLMWLLLHILGEMAIRHTQECWLAGWLVARCADVLVTTRLAM